MTIRHLHRTTPVDGRGQPTRVDIVAADQLLRAGAGSALTDSPQVTVVAPDEPCDVVVLVADAVTEATLDAVRDVRAVGNHPEVVLVPLDLRPAEALTAITAGVRGLLRRGDANGDSLVQAVVASAAGDCTVPPDMLDDLLAHDVTATDETATRSTASGGTGPGDRRVGGPGLSGRERAVLELVAAGHDTGEIALELSYSARTVTGVLHDVTHRFRLRNRAHAVAFAMRTGLL